MPVSLTCSCSSCPAHGQSLTASVSCPFYPSSSLTDTEWALLAPLLPPPGNHRGPPPAHAARRPPREVAAAVDPGRDLLSGPRRHRLGAAAARLPSGENRLSATGARVHGRKGAAWPTECVGPLGHNERQQPKDTAQIRKTGRSAWVNTT